MTAAAARNMGVLAEVNGTPVWGVVEEGSALVTYEAQVAGCVPLVSRAAGALLERIGPPGRVTFVPGNHDAYAASAAAYTIGLNEDPGCLTAVTARLNGDSW